MNTMDFIALRFTGNNVYPSNTRCKDTAALIRAAEDLVTAIIAHQDDETDLEEPLGELSVIAITHESLGLRFSGNRMPAVFLAWQLVAGAINTGNFERLPLKARESLEEIAHFVKKRGAPALLTDSKHSSPIASIETDFSLPESLSVKGGTSVIGTVLRVGGKEPKLRLQLPSGQILTCDTSEQIAKELGHKLYDTVVCRGEATWDLSTNEVTKFRIKEVGIFKQGPASEAFMNLAKVMPRTLSLLDAEDSESFTSTFES